MKKRHFVHGGDVQAITVDLSTRDLILPINASRLKTDRAKLDLREIMR